MKSIKGEKIIRGFGALITTGEPDGDQNKDGKGADAQTLATLQAQVASVIAENERLKLDIKTAAEKRDGFKKEKDEVKADAETRLNELMAQVEALKGESTSAKTIAEQKIQKILDAKLATVPENLKPLFENANMLKLSAEERLDMIVEAESKGLLKSVHNPNPRQVAEKSTADLEKMNPNQLMQYARDNNLVKTGRVAPGTPQKQQ
jgi:hypothetical protein